MNQFTRSAKRKLLLRIMWYLLLLPMLFLHALAQAQEHGTDEDWQEHITTYFIILYIPGEEATMQHYASFVDTIYEDIATIFNHRVSTPITMRLYPTQESYAKVNPLAPKLPGIVAHADFRRREVAVVLPSTKSQTPQEVQNNIRHELTHIVATDLSQNRLNTGLQEGLAQYVEEQVPSLDRKITLLARLVEHDQLMAWSDYDEREKVYAEPDQTYPQTLSVVAFLIDRYGFSKFRDFLDISSRSSGYRSAMERTYGISPTDLEAAWKQWLPSYIQGGYRQNALATYDLSHARELLDLGQYDQAQAELEQAISWMRSHEEQRIQTQSYDETLQKAEELLTRSRDGQQAEQLTAHAYQALTQSDYEQAKQFVALARSAYAKLGDTRQDHVLILYEQRINRGLNAQAQLDDALRLTRMLQFPQARKIADRAASEFATLGDASRLNQAVNLRRTLDGRQYLAGLAMIGIGVIGITFSLWGHWSLHEEEVW